MRRVSELVSDAMPEAVELGRVLCRRAYARRSNGVSTRSTGEQR
jgi:hypothetical protein